MSKEENKENNILTKNQQKGRSLTTGVFIGRFQPFHEGHKKCVEHILSKHDRCLILLRDTTVTDKNPFTVEERKEKIVEKMQTDRIVFGVIPDEDCDLTIYIGRDVGYSLIKLDEQTEKISATDIRKQMYDWPEKLKSG